MSISSDAPLRVLLVEDQDDHSTLITRQLDRAGGTAISLQHARTLECGLKLMGSLHFDAVLLDLSLPDSSPSETLTAVMEEDTRAAVIVLTSLDDVEFATLAVEAGAQDFLPKSKLDGDLLMRSIRYSVRRKAANLELELRNQELLRFAETVAHEVRTPMHVVSCCLQVLEKKCAPLIDERMQELIIESRDSMQAISGLTRKLLEFATVGTGKQEFERLDLNEVFDSALSAMESEGELDGAVITRDGLPEMEGEEVLLRQVFVNLVGNAVKYRREDETPVIKLLCTLDENSKMCELVLQDTGKGIAPEGTERLFEIFERGENVGEVEGQGIGLAFCKKVIEHHGGMIGAEPEKEQGCRIVIRLPYVSGGAGGA
ncbi:hypothetical protein BH23VER1_BH23VER1_09400 [soil metagenome]